MKLKIFTFTILIFSSLMAFSNSENNYSVPKQNKTSKKYKRKADRLYRNDKLTDAITYYEKAIENSPDDFDVNVSLGMCYFNLKYYTKSLIYFEKAKSVNDQNENVIYLLARNYHSVSNYDTAIIFYNKYLSLNSNLNSRQKEIIQKDIQQCNNALSIEDNSKNVYIQKLSKEINTQNHEYSPVYIENSEALIYTSRKENSIGGLKRFYDNDYFEDIFISSLRIDNSIDSNLIDLKHNTRTNDATSGISGDGNTLFLFTDNNGGDIIFQSLNKDEENTVFSDKINSKYFDASASSTADCSEIYFISNRPENNLGAKDVFCSKRDSTGNWSKPENLGDKINTEENEASVFISPDGNTLYFSSRGHNTIGGYDIFKSTKDSLGNWQNPENMGIPINTPNDDVFFSKYGTTAYYSTISIDEISGFDIYQVEFLEIEETVTDTISDDVANMIDRFGDDYNLNLGKNNYLFQNSDFNIMEDTTSTVSKTENDTVVKPDLKFFMNIEFDYGKISIGQNSQKSLDTLSSILKLNPEYKIVISGHTDNIGSYESNMTLSEQRAQNVANFLINKGISSDLITTKGFSYSKPISTNETEEGRAKNRRVEFEFYRIDK